METKSTAFYRGYLPDDWSLIPLTIVLAIIVALIIVALWLLVYLVSAVGPQPTLQTGEPAAQLSTAT
jgi:flagellar biogenesis protein FliO